MRINEPIVVGKTISALLYAWRLQRKCILLEPFLYHPLSEEFENIDFSEFNVENGEEFTQNLLFVSSLTSNLLYQGNISGIRLDDKRIITKGNRRITLNSDVEIFDAKKIVKITMGMPTNIMVLSLQIIFFAFLLIIVIS